MGALEGSASTAYLRPETAQGTFVNFRTVRDVSRAKVPFGIAQVKALSAFVRTCLGTLWVWPSRGAPLSCLCAKRRATSSARAPQKQNKKGACEGLVRCALTPALDRCPPVRVCALW